MSSIVNLYRDMGVAAPGVDTDAIPDVTLQESHPVRLTIQVAVGTVVNLMIARTGETEVAAGMNSNNALVAGALYQFDAHGVAVGDVLNVQVETDSAIDWVSIDQVRP